MRKVFSISQDNFKTVLLVSDHQVDIRRIEKQFMDTGSMDCRLYRCTTIAAALEQLGRKNLTIDIIILDLRLDDPAATGSHYQTIKTDAGDIPIIVLTGDSEEERRLAEPIIASGAADHIYKDNFGSLVWTIGNLLFSKTGG